MCRVSMTKLHWLETLGQPKVMHLPGNLEAVIIVKNRLLDLETLMAPVERHG